MKVLWENIDNQLVMLDLPSDPLIFCYYTSMGFIIGWIFHQNEYICCCYFTLIISYRLTCIVGNWTAVTITVPCQQHGGMRMHDNANLTWTTEMPSVKLIKTSYLGFLAVFFPHEANKITAMSDENPTIYVYLRTSPMMTWWSTECKSCQNAHQSTERKNKSIVSYD